MKFKVWFDQVNQQVFEVEAKDEEEATRKAQKSWMLSFQYPEPSYIEKYQAGYRFNRGGNEQVNDQKSNFDDRTLI